MIFFPYKILNEILHLYQESSSSSSEGKMEAQKMQNMFFYQFLS